MRICRIVGPNFEGYPFVSTSSITLTIESRSGQTATVAVVGTEGLNYHDLSIQCAKIRPSLKRKKSIHKYTLFLPTKHFFFPKNPPRANILWKDGHFKKITDYSSLFVFQNLFESPPWAMNLGYWSEKVEFYEIVT